MLFRSGEFIGPEGSDVEGLNQAVQETTGRKADMPERNALLNKQNWLDSIFQRKDPFGPGERLGATTEDYSGTPTETMPSREDRDRGANLWRRLAGNDKVLHRLFSVSFTIESPEA